MDLRQEVTRLAPWYQNIHLGDGVLTRPDHPDGDYPQTRLDALGPFLPSDLTGKSVLDIGCNAGFFALEMKRRGATRVLGIDVNEHVIRQARFVAGHCGVDVEYRELDCYEIPALDEEFDVVVFLGVLYHLRHPLLMLDLIRAQCRELMLFQTVLTAPPRPIDIPRDLERSAAPPLLEDRAFPRLWFVENSLGGDKSNWWLANGNAVFALLRSAGFTSVHETSNPEVMVVYPGEGPPGAERLAGLEHRSRHLRSGAKGPPGGVRAAVRRLARSRLGHYA